MIGTYIYFIFKQPINCLSGLLEKKAYNLYSVGSQDGNLCNITSVTCDDEQS